MFVFVGQYTWLFAEALKIIGYLVCVMETLLMGLAF